METQKMKTNKKFHKMLQTSHTNHLQLLLLFYFLILALPCDISIVCPVGVGGGRTC